jgi:hypothetical protein
MIYNVFHLNLQKSDDDWSKCIRNSSSTQNEFHNINIKHYSSLIINIKFNQEMSSELEIAGSWT